jgi:3-methyladenine DNA glycosylase AlkD
MQEHAEVLAALRAIGNPQRGAAIQRDRGSSLVHLGIGFPALRARVKAGFSFSRQPLAQQLAIWDTMWHQAEVGDVLFAALAWLEPRVRDVRRGPPDAALWPVVRHWHSRVDNWCHADMLAGVISRLLQARPDEVLPQLQAWNRAEGLWQRRLSLTSLIHYSGKNAVFLPPATMLPLLQNTVADARAPVQLALGWVLRELGRVQPAVAEAFVRDHAAHMGAQALARAVEAWPAERRSAVLALSSRPRRLPPR